MSDLLKIVGDRIRHFRTIKNLSQEQLALLANVDTSHIGRIERGTSNSSIEMLDKIITAMGVSLEDFFKQTQHSDGRDDELLSAINAKLIMLDSNEKECILELVNAVYKLTKKQ